LLSDSANCTVLSAVVLAQYRRVTDGRTDGRNCYYFNASIAARCKNSTTNDAVRRAVPLRPERDSVSDSADVNGRNSSRFMPYHQVNRGSLKRTVVVRSKKWGGVK